MSQADGMQDREGPATDAEAADAKAALDGADEAIVAGADALSVRDAERLAELRGKLARYSGPGYRKSYLANLLESGKRYMIAGNPRGAEYCFAKVNQDIAVAIGTSETQNGDIDSLDSDGGNAPEASAAESEAEGSSDASASGGEAGSGSVASGQAGDRPRKSGSTRRKAKERPLSPTEIFRRNWRQERIKDAEEVLKRHGGRLSSLENQAYKEKLEKLRQTGADATTPLQSDKADASLMDLRRRLYGRVLKSQKLALSHRRMPMTLARLALPPASRGANAPSPNAAPAAPSKQLATGSAVRVDAAWQPVIGPYNDRYNMEDLLTLIADADAAWVEEFLDLYRGLSGLQNLVASIASLKKT